MKQNTQRIIMSVLIVIVACGIGIYNTVHRNSHPESINNSIDYQLNIDYHAHPVASFIGSIIPGILAGFTFYWWGSWRARRKQKNLSSINPKEASELAASNIDGQHDEAINNFLLKASASDIQEFILNIHEQSGYVQRAKTALDIRLAEDAKIHSRHTVRLTWALLFVSVALLAFPFLQMIISKNHEVVKPVANDANTSTVTQTGGNEVDKEKPPTENSNASAFVNEFKAEQKQVAAGLTVFDLSLSYEPDPVNGTNYVELTTLRGRIKNDSSKNITSLTLKILVFDSNTNQIDTIPVLVCGSLTGYNLLPQINSNEVKSFYVSARGGDRIPTGFSFTCVVDGDELEFQP